MFYLQNMVIDIRAKGLKKCNTSRVISLGYIKCDKLFFVVLMTVIWSINTSNCLDQKHHNGKHYSFGGQFVDEEEAKAIAIEANIRLAKIPCNFTTKINCIYAERQQLAWPIKDVLEHGPQYTNEIVVSWASDSDAMNSIEQRFDTNGRTSNMSSINNNVRGKSQNDFFNFNWIFELLACMMLACAFEVCLLLLRNLRNISLAFSGFWSAFNASLQKFFNTYNTGSASYKGDQQRKRNAAMGEKRTLSYIFAILSWRASQTAKGCAPTAEANLKDESNQNSISYGHVTTMGDLLLLILFTHVYYQRQKLHQDAENENSSDPEQLFKDGKAEEKDPSDTTCQKFYDKQNSIDNSFNEANSHRHGSHNRCSHFCEKMYQQITCSLQERKSPHAKLTAITSCASKIPYLSYCTGFVCYTCCFCQYSFRSCCNCWNQRCCLYIPLHNTLYCCCFYKSLKSFRNINYQYCCYLCCWQDICHVSNMNFLATHYCCHCHFYCSYCNILINKMSYRAASLLLLHKIKYSSLNIYTYSNEYSAWKLFCQVDGQTYSLVYVADVDSMLLYKHSYYQFAVNLFNHLLPQYVLAMKNCQAFLKWRKLHVAVVIMALVVICASSVGADYNHPHYYTSLLNRCNKHLSKCRQSKRKRRRRRRRNQNCKAIRPQHYFYTALIQCVKRQKSKKVPKKFVDKLHRKSSKLLTAITVNYEHSLSTAVATPKAPMVRAIRRVRGSKPNIVWLLIGLIWFEGPKIVNCNVIINYQNQQQHEQQQQHQHQQQTGNTHKETTANSVNSNIEYKIENFNQMKTKNSNNNSNSSNNNNKNKNKNNNSSNNNNNNNNNNNTNNSNRSSSASNSSDIHLSVDVIPIINTINFKHYCNSNYQKLIRSSQRVQRALKPNPNLDTSVTSSASFNYNNVNDDLDSEQLPSSSFQNLNEESHTQSDLMRLESIKHQILFKLGLTRKPIVSHPLPKQFIWDTIYRADGIKSFHEFSNTNNFQEHHHFTPNQNYPYWSTEPSEGSNIVNRQQREGSLEDSNNIKGSDNIKRSLQNVNSVVRKKYSKTRQQQQQTHFEHYNNNNDITFRERSSATSPSKNLNQLLYTTSTTTILNRNKLSSHTNKTVNNFTILKQFKHQQFHKNSPHSTTTITSAREPTIHQQQQKQQNLKQHEQFNQHTNNSNKNTKNKYNTNNNSNNNNNNSNNNNNVNNSNNNKHNNNNIIMVQKHLRNNNKYIEEEKKLTYLTDINSSDDSLNIMEEDHNPDSDDNNSILRRKNRQHQHHHKHNHNLDIFRDHVQPLQQQLQQKHEDQHLNIDDIVDVGGGIGVDRNVNMESQIIYNNEGVNDNDDDHDNDYDDDDQHYQYNEHQHRHDNYFSKLDTFDENDDFFGSTQEIITFAERGKMYKNHRLVEFSHQNNEKTKQKLHVRYAEIHIRIDKIALKNKSRAGSGIKRKRLKIWIFQLIENNYTYKRFDHVARFCASFEVDTSRLGWKKFDITTTVKEWYARREGEKLRLLIDCTGCGKMYSVHLFNSNNAKGDINIRGHRIANQKPYANMNDINSKNFYNVTHNKYNLTNLQYNQTLVVMEKDKINRRNTVNADNTEGEDVMNSSRPFLVLHTEARRQRRVRRRAINCNGALHGQCCKESFYVSFKALGWDDWIIAPRGYFANYCRGDCTGPYRTPDTFQTFHAHFIEEYRKMGLLNGMQPCCAPIKFSSMSLIYYGDEGIIKRDLPKMVVDECGCP